MEKEFVPYDLALELKELGFEEKTFDIYSDGVVYNFSNRWIIKPTRKILWQQAFDWLWNKTGKYIIPIPNDNKEWLCMGNKFKTYEEARLECLKKLINIIK